MSEGGDNNGGLYFIVGALVVVVGIGAYVLFGAHGTGGGAASSAGGPAMHTTTVEKTTVAPSREGNGVSITTRQSEHSN